ncbi:MAG: MMPL family transporter [Ahniella sp.]|nr:MMPL family transporter [Ahniella sp.]
MNFGRILRLLILLVVLALLGFVVVREFTVSADLRAFMPAPETADEHLLLDQIAEGPGSRLLFLTIDGVEPETLAEQSQELKQALMDQAPVRLVANGSESLDDLPGSLLNLRYLLTDRFDTQPLHAELLHEALLEREGELASPAAFLLEDWLARDPTLEVLHLAERQKPSTEPQREFDVWFETTPARALLIVEPIATAFDAAANKALIAQIQSVFDELAKGSASQLQINGPGAYGVRMEARIRNEANTLGLIATGGMVLLMVVAYRRMRYVLLGALPLLAAGLAGVAAVASVFGSVHGVTLAFGFTLIGVAQDYPLHLLSHLSRHTTAEATARSIWPTLLTGVASTSIAYLAFYVSGVAGLQQLAVFTVTGLLVAAVITRWILPDWVGSAPAQDRSRALQATATAFRQLATFRPLVPVLAVIALGWLVWQGGPAWENNLARLSPLPKAWLDREIELRRALGTPDMRYLLVIDAATAQAALESLEQLDPELQQLVGAGVMAGYEHAARLLPAEVTQRARQAKLPDPEAAQLIVASAVADTAFDAEVFTPFLDDLATAREARPLSPKDFAGSPLALKLDSLLLDGESGATALITLSGEVEAGRIADWAKARPHVRLLDLKGASEQMVVRYRQHVLDSLLVAALLLGAVIALALRSWRRTLRVILPMLLSTVFVLALLSALGIPLSLFHLIALVLAAGLGIDYALFFEASEHESADPSGQDDPLASRHALLVCAGSTMMVFALLATSSLPVLRALGLTVSLGVLCNFLLALILLQTRRSVAPST